jgi:AraC-like DNA-binding protein
VAKPASRAAITGRHLPAWARARTQAATYPRLFLDVACEHGVDREAVLRSAGLDRAHLEDPGGRVSLVEIWRVHEAVAARLDAPTLGFETGLRLPLTAHGTLGYALMCAPTPRAAIALLERFWHLRGRGASMQARTRDDELFMEVVPELPMPPWLRDLVLASMLASIWRGIGFLMPIATATVELWLPGPEPRGFAAIRAQLPTVRFEMPLAGVRVVGDPALLDRAQPTATPEGLAQALSQCERESALMGTGADPLVARARAALHLGARGYPSPAAVAKALHVTQRTFRRRLQEQGTSFLALREEARRRDACRLLARPELSIKEIGALLGYREPANFTRAFRAWMGVPPSAWRSGRG